MNQVDYSLESRIGVIGVVTDPGSSAVPNACVAVFTEKGHKFVFGRMSDAKGAFHLPLLKDGAYRLVIKVEGFGAANAKFEKIPETYTDLSLHVHMRTQGIDVTSYIDTKK